MYLSPIVSFFKLLCQNMPYSAETWHALSHKQYLLKYHFFGICRYGFKLKRKQRFLEI